MRYDEFLNKEEAEAKTRYDYSAPLCDYSGCGRLAVKGEWRQCREHQIETILDVMEEADWGLNPTYDDVGEFILCYEELERLRAL